jgi:hypothetical protein
VAEFGEVDWVPHVSSIKKILNILFKKKTLTFFPLI